MSYMIIRNYKYIPIILITATLSVILIMSSYNNINSQHSTLRKILDTTMVNNICQKGPESLLSFYKTEEYESKDEELSNDSKYIDVLKELIQTQDFSKALGYIMRVVPFLFFVLMVIITLITWFVLCSCCCCPSCCCFQRKEENCCRLTSFIISVVLLTGIIGLSIYGLLSVSSLFQGINGMFCSLLKLVYETVNGQEISKVPKWNGITGITKILEESISVVDTIKANADSAFLNTAWTTTAIDVFKNLLGQKYNLFKLETITNLDPLGPNPAKITPIYIEKYGPYGTSGSAQYAIFEEYKIKIGEGAKMIETGKEATKIIKDNADEVKAGIQVGVDLISSLDSTFESLDGIVNTLNTYLGYVDEYGNLAFLILFAVYGGLSLFSIILILPFVLCKQKWARFFLHFFWNIIMVICIAVFLIGAVFGILGVVFLDVVGVLQFTLSQENMISQEPFLIPGDANEIISICLHGDGDISKKFNLDQVDQLDSLYALQDNLLQLKTTLEGNTKSIAIKEINTQYDTLMDNFILATEGLSNAQANKEFEDQLKVLNTKINDKAIGCASGTRKDDIWVPTKSLCPTDYIYRSYSATEANTKNCFVIKEYTSGRYNCDNSASIIQYLNNLKKYNSDNQALITKLKNSNTNDLDAEYYKSADALIKNIDSVNTGVLTPLTDVFKTFIGDSNIFSIVNCKYMGNYITVFLDQFKMNFAQKVYDFSIILLTLGSCVYFGMIFLIITINRYKKIDPEKPKEKSEEPKQNQDNSNDNLQDVKINENNQSELGINPSYIQIKSANKP